MEKPSTIKPSFIIIMGVSGSGKTTIGTMLAQALEWDFYDADDFHPPENIAKMANGIPLDDQDRAPWLALLHNIVIKAVAENRPGVLACSALKERYRKVLTEGASNVLFIYLKSDFNTIFRRLNSRQGHFMKAPLLSSQFEILEEPWDALTIDAALPLDIILKNILEFLNMKSQY